MHLSNDFLKKRYFQMREERDAVINQNKLQEIEIERLVNILAHSPGSITSADLNQMADDDLNVSPREDAERERFFHEESARLKGLYA